MAKLTESVFVKCPYHRARIYLAENVATFARTHSKLTLHVPVKGVKGSFDLKKDVVVAFTPGTDPMHMDRPWQIHWTPESGPFPSFEGELTVRADEDYSSCILELVGDYTPPGGPIGIAFDSIIGWEIASLTGRMLLKQFGDEFEQRYNEEEAQKRIIWRLRS